MTEVANILAKYPEWDCSPWQLKLPAITWDSKEIPYSANHIKPAAWKGNVKVKNVPLQTAWRHSCHIVEEECTFTSDMLHLLKSNPKSSIFSPFGIFLITAPLESDDIDESLENLTAGSLRDGTDFTSHIELEAPTDTEACIDIKDALVDLACESDDTISGSLPISHTIMVNGVAMLKLKALARYSKYWREASSTDHL